MKQFFSNLKWILISAACVAAGLMLCIMAFQPDNSVASSIFSFVCGLIFLALPTLLAYRLIEDKIKKRKKNAGADGAGQGMADPQPREKQLFPWYETVTEDNTPTESMIRRFRREYRIFYETPGIRENSPVQNSATQLLYSIFGFRKKRLDRKKITLRFESERKQYDKTAAAESHTVFDGKYEVTEVTESIAARSTFLRGDGTRIYSRMDTQAAHYTLIHAKRVGNKYVICPNCGAESTRESLIDGCDYCGSRFTVEDIGTRVADFSLQNDYEIQYAKYRKQRGYFGVWVLLAVAIPIFLIGMGICLSMGREALIEMGDGSMAVAVLAAIMASAFAGGAIGVLAMYGFWFLVFPFVQLSASAAHFTGKRLKQLKEQEKFDKELTAKIRQDDPLFSMAGFYSGLQNKLASIHYADTKDAIQAFSDADMTPYLKTYADVIDMDFESLRLCSYTVDAGYRKAVVTAQILLRTYTGSSVQTRRENLRLCLKKSASCMTQAVGSPQLFTCDGCGASIPLEAGKICLQCGRVFDLKQHDWVITSYEVMQL